MINDLPNTRTNFQSLNEVEAQLTSICENDRNFVNFQKRLRFVDEPLIFAERLFFGAAVCELCDYFDSPS